MYVCVYMSIYLCVCMYVCICICMYVPISSNASMYVEIYLDEVKQSIYVYICVYMYVQYIQ